MKDRISMKWKQMEILCIIIVSFFLILLVRMMYQPNADSEANSFVSLSSDWYQIKNGERTDLELPCSVITNSDGEAILYNDTLTDADIGKFVSIRGVQNHLEIRLGDQLLYQYRDDNFQKNSQMKGKLWADACLSDKTGQEPLCLIFRGRENSRLYVQAPLIGAYSDIIRHHFQESAFSILMIFGMIGLGIVSVIIYFYARHRKIAEKRFFDVAVFLILCSLWCILDSGIYQMYGKQSAAGTLVSFYAFMLMSVPILHFIQDTVSKNKRWIPQIWILLLYGNAVLQTVIHIILQVPFVHMLFVTHLILFTGVIAMILLLWREYRRNQTQVLGLCLKAFEVLGLSGVSALALYWIFSIYWYDAVFQFGIVLYIAFLFWGLLCKVSDDVQFRLEQAVYERMSLEDRMTGLKNRKAFEQSVDKIQKEAAFLENVLLLFIEIDDLKKINDMYGLQRGDEAVIRTARSIRPVENDSNEQQVQCFRIEGDEFAVIVSNPQKTPDEWEHFIKDELKKETTGGNRVHLKFGYSYLRKTDGTLVSISDWKMQADQMLLFNKEKESEDKYELL